MIEKLVNHRSIDLNLKDVSDKPPLFLAAGMKNYGAVELLLKCGASVNICNMVSDTPLHIAASVGDHLILNLLLSNGAEKDAINQSGKTALHIAAINNHLEAVKILKSKGANPNIQDISGKQPQHLTTSNEVLWVLTGMKTSDSHPLVIDFIKSPLLGSSRLGMTMCPGRSKKTWRRTLASDINMLLNEKTEVLVTLVQQSEFDSMGIPNFVEEVQRANIEVLHFPIKDKWIPSSMDYLVNAVQEILKRMKQGKCIVVHCNGGKGRTGLIVTAILVTLGMDVSPAIDLTREAREGMIRNPAQIFYAKAFRKRWMSMGVLTVLN
eukprot:TRINITY_DN1320_c0_g1_i4.p1 TRINITY_DN1320_c0_g1~~TRINITY_DN1320_c0_g1_i4.p1  ORF type:complete len:323 (-),score=57.99 TRINITY_DN1320_c0_g1_i4:119-1087(-)